MTWEIDFFKSAQKEFAQLPHEIKKHIRDYLKQRVQPDPLLLGENLSGQFKGFRRYRVGDFRLICLIKTEEQIVTVMKIGHRREVYKHLH